MAPTQGSNPSSEGTSTSGLVTTTRAPRDAAHGAAKLGVGQSVVEADDDDLRLVVCELEAALGEGVEQRFLTDHENTGSLSPAPSQQVRGGQYRGEDLRLRCGDAEAIELGGELRRRLGRIVRDERIGNALTAPSAEGRHRIRNRALAAANDSVEIRDDCSDRRLHRPRIIEHRMGFPGNRTGLQRKTGSVRRSSRSNAISVPPRFMSHPLPRGEKRQQRNRGALGIRGRRQLV
jgi:hypothetical protein